MNLVTLLWWIVIDAFVDFQQEPITWLLHCCESDWGLICRSAGLFSYKVGTERNNTHFFVGWEILEWREGMCCWVVVARGAPPVLTKCNWAHKRLVHCTISVWFCDNHTYLTVLVSSVVYYVITISLYDLTVFSLCQMEKYLHFRDTSKWISCKLCGYFPLL